VRIVRVEPRDLAPAVWERLTGGSFFASPGFLELWRTRGGRAVAWLAERDGIPAAVIPGVEYGFGPLARFVSLPEGCYGGVFADPLVGDARPGLSRALLDAIARRRYAKSWVFDFRATATGHPAFSGAAMETVLADISDPDWMPADRKLVSQIRKARREGIAVQRFEWARHGEGFLSLVQGTARHHRVRPRYPARVYRALAGLAERDPRVRWVYCQHQGRPASSHIYFVEGDTIQAWQSHFDRSFSFLKANQYIRFAECREGARQGVRWLNLGSTPPGALGVAYYKARWGARRLRFVAWHRFEGLGALADALRAAGAADRSSSVGTAAGSAPDAGHVTVRTTS
jgi:hypothetical protein